MKKSKLEAEIRKSKSGLLNRIDSYFIKLAAYVIDGVPMSKNVSSENKLTYSRF